MPERDAFLDHMQRAREQLEIALTLVPGNLDFEGTNYLFSIIRGEIRETDYINLVYCELLEEAARSSTPG